LYLQQYTLQGIPQSLNILYRVYLNLLIFEIILRYYVIQYPHLLVTLSLPYTHFVFVILTVPKLTVYNKQGVLGYLGAQFKHIQC